MGWLGRLLGKNPPRVPAGGRAFSSLDTDASGRNSWSVRVQMPSDAEPTSLCRRISPVFQLQTSAEAYLDWVNGGPSFQYPPGAA